MNYKEVMKQYGLGPNGGIVTSLNLFATRFDQVTDWSVLSWLRRIKPDGHDVTGDVCLCRPGDAVHREEAAQSPVSNLPCRSVCPCFVSIQTQLQLIGLLLPHKHETACDWSSIW